MADPGPGDRGEHNMAPKGSGGLACPKCRQSAGNVQRLDTGALMFKCQACGHQWWLFDRSALQDSER